jgi:hypothetical protein
MARAAVMVEYHGGYRKLVDVCRDHGIDRQTVQSRLNKGWSLDAALTKRPRRYPRDVRRRRHHVAPAVPDLPPPVDANAADLLRQCLFYMNKLDWSERLNDLILACRRWLRRNSHTCD